MMKRVALGVIWVAMAVALFGTPAAAADSSITVQPVTTKDDPGGAELRKNFIWTQLPKDQSRPYIFPESGHTASQQPYFVAFRRKVNLDPSPRSASLRIFADVRYILWINGHYEDRGPCRFQDNGPEYDTLDVSHSFHPGENTLAVLVLASASNGKMMRHLPALAVRLEADGSEVLKTDDQWVWSDKTRYRTPKITWGNVADQIDARVEDGDWTQPEYDDSKWPHAVAVDAASWGPLTARRIPLLRETPQDVTFHDVAVLPATLSAGKILNFSTPHLVQAYVQLDMDATAGAKFDMKLGWSTLSYTAREGSQTYITSDTAGFMDGSITVKTGQVTIRELKIVERIYPFDCLGSFASSDPQLDKLWKVCVRSDQVLSEDAYVDCADRERTEWMDCDPPAADVTAVALAGPVEDGSALTGDPRLSHEMIRRTALTLQPEGWVKAHTCSDRFDIHAKMEDRACDWIEGVRRYYEQTHDADAVREIWPAITTQLKWFLDRRTERGLVRAREWVVWGNPMGYQTCEGAGLNAFIYKSFVDAAYLAKIIGQQDDSDRFNKAATDLAAAFNKVLWDEQDQTYYSGYFAPEDLAHPTDHDPRRKLKLKVTDQLVEPTLFPALFALDQGIVPADRVASVTQYVLKTRSQADRIMTFYYLLKQMYLQNDPALDREALDLFRKKWKGMADGPWMTSWEDFTGGSKAHCYGMFPAYFLSAYVLGVRPAATAYDPRVIIEPHLGDLDHANGTVVTRNGLVTVSWKHAADRLSFTLDLPPAVNGKLRLPQGAQKWSIQLDGKTLPPHLEGEYVTAEISPGKHDGEATTADR